MLVVVGGHTRNIGKTSVIAGLIRTLPEFHWTALKITQYGQDVCSTDGELCECAPADPEHPFAITEETDPASGSDTGRFLAAGARRAYWVRTAAGQLGYAMPALRRILAENGHVIAESNSILQFLRPDLYLVVLDFAAADFKSTSLQYLDRADVLVVVGPEIAVPCWSGVAEKLWQSKPQFRVQPPQWATTPMADLVRDRLISSTASSCAERRDAVLPTDAR